LTAKIGALSRREWRLQKSWHVMAHQKSYAEHPSSSDRAAGPIANIHYFVSITLQVRYY